MQEKLYQRPLWVQLEPCEIWWTASSDAATWLWNGKYVGLLWDAHLPYLRIGAPPPCPQLAAWERRSSMLEELLLLQLHCGQCTINITHLLCPGLCLLQSKLPRMCRKSVRFGINAADNCERGRESHSPVQVSGPGSLHNALMPLKNKLFPDFPSSKVFLLWRCFKLPFATVSYQYLYWCLASQSSQTSSDLLNTLSSRKWIDDGLRMHYCSSSSCCITCAVIAAMMNTVQP